MLSKIVCFSEQKMPTRQLSNDIFAPNVGHCFDDNSYSTLHCTFQSHINSAQIKVSIFCCSQLAEQRSQETDAHAKMSHLWVAISIHFQLPVSYLLGY